MRKFNEIIKHLLDSAPEDFDDWAPYLEEMRMDAIQFRKLCKILGVRGSEQTANKEVK